MPTPLEKGSALELAVHAIESAILRSSPSYQEKTFSVEMKKIVTVAGVRHEIDIWVAVDLGAGYEAFFVFECKNWAEEVGKNELIVFSEKIKVLQAQRGFFVAKSFTSDAEAQAKLDPRITLMRVTDLPVEDIPVPYGFHGINVEGITAEVAVIAAGADETATRENVDMTTATMVINGEAVALEPYARDWISTESDKRVNAFPSQAAEEGLHHLSFESERGFTPGAARTDEIQIGKIRLLGQVQVRVVRAKIISHFEVATRGRALTVALDLGPVQLQGTFVARLLPAR